MSLWPAKPARLIELPVVELRCRTSEKVSTASSGRGSRIVSWMLEVEALKAWLGERDSISPPSKSMEVGPARRRVEGRVMSRWFGSRMDSGLPRGLAWPLDGVWGSEVSGDQGEVDLVKLGVMPQEVLTLLLLLMFAFAAARTAPLVIGVDELPAVGALRNSSIASKCSSGVGLLDISIFEVMPTGRMNVGEVD